MLTFIQTWVLIGLAGVAIPLLIHLFARQKVQKVYFSSVAFLKKIHSQRMRRMKLRQWLLLLLRTLAILFLVLAFARPTIKSVRRVERGGASSSVLIMDRSLSMGGDRLFARARERMRSFLVSMGEEDEAALLWLGGKTESGGSFTSYPESVEKQLLGESVSRERGQILDVLDEGIELLASSNHLNREIFIIGDLQASGFEDVTDSTFSDWEGNAFVLPLVRSEENVGIVECGIENRILQTGAPLRVYAIVRNYGRQDVGGLLLRLSLNGRTVAQEEIGLEAGQEKRVMFRVIPEDDGWISGAFRLDEDALSGDDERFFTAWIPERIRVLLMGNRREDVVPFRRCLRTTGRHDAKFEIHEVQMGEEWVGRLQTTDVTVISNFSSLRQHEADGLRRFIEEGGGVFLWMGDDVDVRSLSGQLLESVDLPIGNIRGSDGGGFLSLESMDYGHPLFQGVFEEDRAHVRSPQFMKTVELMSGPVGRIATLTGGGSWLVERTLGRGRILVSATGIEETWSDLAYTTFFTPLTIRSVVYLAAPEMDVETSLVGESLRWERPIDSEAATTNYRFETPEGEFVHVLPEVVGNRLRFTLGRAHQPGVYSLYQGDTLIGMKAVNIDPRESDLRPMTGEALKDVLPSARLAIVDEDEDILEAVNRIRWGRELWRPMLVLAILALILEMIIGRTGRKSRT